MSFLQFDYEGKKCRTRCGRFLAEIVAVVPPAALRPVIELFYPTGTGRSWPPIGLERTLRMHIAK